MSDNIIALLALNVYHRNIRNNRTQIYLSKFAYIGIFLFFISGQPGGHLSAGDSGHGRVQGWTRRRCSFGSQGKKLALFAHIENNIVKTNET
jgi:hypothetical protein